MAIVKSFLGMDEGTHLIDVPNWKIEVPQLDRAEAVSGLLFLVMAFEWSACFWSMDDTRYVQITDGVIAVPKAGDAYIEIQNSFLGNHVITARV